MNIISCQPKLFILFYSWRFYVIQSKWGSAGTATLINIKLSFVFCKHRPPQHTYCYTTANKNVLHVIYSTVKKISLTLVFNSVTRKPVLKWRHITIWERLTQKHTDQFRTYSSWYLCTYIKVMFSFHVYYY